MTLVRIATLDDMLELPPEQIEDFTLQLRAWLLLHAMRRVPGAPHVPAAFDPRWIEYLPGSAAPLAVPETLRAGNT